VIRRAMFATVRLEVVVLATAAVAIVFLRWHGVRLGRGTVEILVGTMLARWPGVLLAGAVLQAAAHLLGRRSLVGWVRGFVTGRSLVAFGRAWLALAVMSCVYFGLKIAVPLTNPALWDGELWALDRFLHFGVSPSIFAVELFAGTPLVAWIDYWYLLWLTTIVVTQAYVLLDPVRERRVHFALACVLLWLGAAWVYVALPALGPCYFVPEVFDAVRESMPGARLIQQSLWTTYAQVLAARGSGAALEINPFLAVAALPSVHVGAHFMFTLWARRHAPRLWPVFAVATALTFVGSLLTGWHYAVDAYLGMLLAWGAVRLADRWAPVPVSAAPPLGGQRARQQQAGDQGDGDEQHAEGGLDAEHDVALEQRGEAAITDRAGDEEQDRGHQRQRRGAAGAALVEAAREPDGESAEEGAELG